MTSYAIIMTGGKQLTVQAGDTVSVERLPGTQQGETVEFPILALRQGDQFSVGTPQLEQKVTATVLEATRDPKVIVFKNHRTQQYRKKNGHRQQKLLVKIEALPTL
jgi:large subunit ribosomal protein L21